MEVLSLEAMFNIAPQEMMSLPSFPREAMVKAQVSVSPMGEVLKTVTAEAHIQHVYFVYKM